MVAGSESSGPLITGLLIYLEICYAKRWVVSSNVGHSAAHRNKTQKKAGRRYSGSTRGLSILLWSVGFLQSAFSSSNAVMCQMAKKLSVAASSSTDMQQKALNVNTTASASSQPTLVRC